MSMRKPQFTRGGTLIMSSPNILAQPPSRRRPALKRTRTLAFKLNTYNRNNQAISVFQNRPAVEYKNVDLNIVDEAEPATDAIQGPVLLNPLAQGVGNTQRIGRKCTLRSISFRFHTGLQAGGGTFTPTARRFIVVYDRNPNGAAPTVPDVFAQTLFYAHQNLSNTDRFLILIDRIFEGSSSLGQNYGQAYRQISLEMSFIGTGATTADIGTGAIWLFHVSTGGAAAVLNFNSRCRFIDL